MRREDNVTDWGAGHISDEELILADEMRKASIRADLSIACRITLGASLPQGYDATELLARIEDLERRHATDSILSWWYIRELISLMISRMFGSLRRAPETGEWWEWASAITATYSLAMLIIRQAANPLLTPSLVHLARVLKYVNA